MSRVWLVAAAVTIAARCAFGIGASQEWVRDFVSRLNGSTNKVFAADLGDTNGTISVTYELYTVPALVATNSVHATVTNGFIFAYTTNGIYKGGSQTIQATATNLVWNNIQSHVTNGLDRFDAAFDVYGRMIAPSKAKEVAE